MNLLPTRGLGKGPQLLVTAGLTTVVHICPPTGNGEVEPTLRSLLRPLATIKTGEHLPLKSFNGWHQ